MTKCISLFAEMTTTDDQTAELDQKTAIEAELIAFDLGGNGGLHSFRTVEEVKWTPKTGQEG